MRTHGTHAVFHGKVAVGSSRAVLCMLFQIADDGIVNLERKTAPGAEFRERQVMTVGKCHLVYQAGGYLSRGGYVARNLVLYFGYQGQQGYFIQGHFVHIVRYLHVQMPFFVEADFHFFRLEAERRQPFPVDTGQEAAALGHVFQFVACQCNPLHVFDGILELGEEAVGVDRVVAVGKGECALRIGKQLDVGVRGGKLIEVGIENGINHNGTIFCSGCEVTHFIQVSQTYGLVFIC